MSVASLPAPVFVASSASRVRSPHTQALTPQPESGRESHRSLLAPGALKHILNFHPHPGNSEGHASPRPPKKQKVLKTSLDVNRTCEVKDHLKMLSLARKSWEVYAAKMQYQRLRMEELELIKDVIGDELEETEGYLGQMERQMGQLQQDISNSGVGIDAKQRALSLPRLSQDSLKSRSGTYSAGRSGYNISSPGSSSNPESS